MSDLFLYLLSMVLIVMGLGLQIKRMNDWLSIQAVHPLLGWAMIALWIVGQVWALSVVIDHLQLR